MSLFAIGYNGFRQLSQEDVSIVFTPTRIRSTSVSVEEPVLLGASWDKVIFRNENNEIVIKGFDGTTSGVDRTIKIELDGKAVNTEDLKAVCCNETTSYCLTTSGIGRQCAQNVNEALKMEKVEVEHIFSDICLAGVSENLYCITSSGQLHCLHPRLETSLMPLPAIVVSVDCGAHHCLALTDTGLAYSWGTGSRGQLGHGCLSDEKKPKLVDMLCGISIAAVSAGGWHSAALSGTGDVYIWGWNERGQLGFPSVDVAFRESDQTPPSVDTEEGNNTQTPVAMLSSPALLEFELYVGSEEFVTVSQVSCGSRHSGAVLSDGRTLTWGWGKYGQLGHACCCSWEGSTFGAEGGDAVQEKRRRVEEEGVRTSCSDTPHPPRLVEYFRANKITVKSVKCSKWNTFFETMKIC